MAHLGKIIAWIWTVAMLLFAAFAAMERAWLPLAFYLIAFGLSMPLLRLPIGGKVRAVISVVLALAAAVIHGDELNRAADEDKAYWVRENEIGRKCDSHHWVFDDIRARKISVSDPRLDVERLKASQDCLTEAIELSKLQPPDDDAKDLASSGSRGLLAMADSYCDAGMDETDEVDREAMVMMSEETAKRLGRASEECKARVALAAKKAGVQM